VDNLNNISQKEFETIEAYINGQLSNENKTAFENRLKNEKDFASKVEDIKVIIVGIESQSLKEQLNSFHDELDINNDTYSIQYDTKTTTFNWKKLAIAAVFIIGTSCFLIFNSNSNTRLYSKHFTPDPGLPTTMSSSDDYTFYEAMVNYKQGDYKTAISKWETLQKTKPNNDTLNYFIGVAHMANKNEDVAISFLENASKNSGFPLISDAYHYLGLAYLKANKLDKAKENLQKSNSENSKALLSTLNE